MCVAMLNWFIVFSPAALLSECMPAGNDRLLNYWSASTIFWSSDVKHGYVSKTNKTIISAMMLQWGKKSFLIISQYDTSENDFTFSSNLNNNSLWWEVIRRRKEKRQCHLNCCCCSYSLLSLSHRGDHLQVISSMNTHKLYGDCAQYFSFTNLRHL